MNTTIIEAIKNIIWFIPSKKLRNSVRMLLIEFYNKLDNIETLSAYNASKHIDNLIIKKISGGFADQILHYSLSRLIETEYGRKIKYDISWYGENINGTRNSNRNFELTNIFPNLKFEVASNIEQCVYRKIYNHQLESKKSLKHFLDKDNQIAIYTDLLNTGMDIKGIYQIEDILKGELDFDKYVYPLLDEKNLAYYNEIKSAKISVGIHIRRGDYINFSKKMERNIPDETYFINAINFISSKLETKNIKFFFFSDDIDWVKSKIIPKIDSAYNYMLIEGNDDKAGYVDFYLLMNSMHQIGSVGGFCNRAHFFCMHRNKILITPLSNENINTPKIAEGFIF